VIGRRVSEARRSPDSHTRPEGVTGYSSQYYENRDHYAMWRAEAGIACEFVASSVTGTVVEVR
jgi:hypothetical protein